jgi:glycosyltransferase involved in cell wall biosynthesis
MNAEVAKSIPWYGILIASRPPEKNKDRTIEIVQMPKVSIGMPVYNGDDFIREAIVSILSQTFKDLELIISDNGSADETERICRAYAKEDKRIRYYRYDDNRGAAWNYNNTFKLAKGEYFKWMAHDDLLHPAFLEKSVAYLDKHPDFILCYSRVKTINEPGLTKTYDWSDSFTRVDSDKPYERFRDGLYPWLCFSIFSLIRTDVLNKTTLHGNYAGADQPLLAELSLRGKWHILPGELLIKRDHLKTSVRASNYDYKLFSVWFDPRNRNRIVFSSWSLLIGYCKAIARVRLNAVNRLFCYLILTRWVLQPHILRNLITEILSAIRQFYDLRLSPKP